MAADDRASADVLDLVSLMYRADWTTLSLAAEITEFHDHDAFLRMRQPPRPPWAPPPRKRPGPPGHSQASRHQGWAASTDDAEDDEVTDEGEFELPSTREERHHLLLAPGGRFRLETRSDRGWSSFRMSDGQVSWQGADSELSADESDEDEPEGLSPARPPLNELLCPAWLPANLSLELAGSAEVAGRRALRVIGSQRPIEAGRRRHGRSALRPAHRGWTSARADQGRVDALIDAELGILLRSELIYSEQVVSRYEITGITLDPPEANSTDFTSPPGAADSGGQSPFSGPGWERAKTAANLGASALSFAIRHAPHREPPAGSRPGPGFGPVGRGAEWPGEPGPDQPVSAEIVSLIYEAGLRQTQFDAELRTWVDTASAPDAFRRLTGNTTMPGVTQLADAMTARATAWQAREALRVDLPDRYRIDYIDGGVKRRAVISEASDGSKRWRTFAGYVAVGPALQLPPAIARLVDPAWLLDWQLTGGVEVIQAGRRGLRVKIGQRWGSEDDLPVELPAEAIVDAQLGILLQLTREHGGRPARQQTLTAVTVRERRDPGEFVIQIPPGARVVQDTGGLTDEIEMPPAMHAAIHLAGRAASGAVKVGSFLDSLRHSGHNRD